MLRNSLGEHSPSPWEKYRMKYFYIFITFLFLFAGKGEAALAPEAQDLFKKGFQAYQDGQYGTAIWHYEKVVDIDPNFAPVYNMLGLAHQKNGAPLSDVVWYFRVASDIDPRNEEAYENLCRFYYQARQFRECEAACKKLLELNPGAGSAKMQLAWNYLVGLRQPAEAIHYFKEVSIFVKEPVVYFGLGMAYAQNEDYAEALEMITKLRSMGADEFAVQLENVTRAASYSPAVGPQRMMIFPEKTGTIVGAQTPVEKPPMAPDSTSQEPSQAVGTMRVRLRGTLTPPPGAQQETESTAPQEHPGSLSPAERIRQLREQKGSGY